MGHLGTAEKSVDHELIAPQVTDLTFELNLFSASNARATGGGYERYAWLGTKEWA